MAGDNAQPSPPHPTPNEVPAYRALYKRQPRLLYHYTTATGLRGIFDSKTIWATHARFLNDRSELTHARERISYFLESKQRDGDEESQVISTTMLESLKSFLSREVFPAPYIASFSSQGDLLSQWERYSEHFGYSIGFRRDALQDIAIPLPVGNLFKVVYDEKVQSKILSQFFDLIKRALRKHSERKSPPEETNALMLSSQIHLEILATMFKHSAYKEEREWRFVKFHNDHGDDANLHFRNGQFGLVPYLEIPLTVAGDFRPSRIIVGPTHYKDEALKAVELLASSHGVKLKRDQYQSSLIPKRT